MTDEPPTTIECHSPCSGTGYYLEQYDTYACPLCGDIAFRENVSTTSNGVPLLAGGDEKNFVRFVGTVLLDDVLGGPYAMIKLPHGANEDLKELPFRESERRWSDEVEHWVILDSWRRRAVEHMREYGWDVIDLVSLRTRHQRRLEDDHADVQGNHEP